MRQLRRTNKVCKPRRLAAAVDFSGPALLTAGCWMTSGTAWAWRRPYPTWIRSCWLTWRLKNDWPRRWRLVQIDHPEHANADTGPGSAGRKWESIAFNIRTSPAARMLELSFRREQAFPVGKVEIASCSAPEKSTISVWKGEYSGPQSKLGLTDAENFFSKIRFKIPFDL